MSYVFVPVMTLNGTSVKIRTSKVSKAHRWGIGAKMQDQPTPVSKPLLATAHVVLEKKSSVLTTTDRSLRPSAMALAQVTMRTARFWKETHVQKR